MCTLRHHTTPRPAHRRRHTFLVIQLQRPQPPPMSRRCRDLSQSRMRALPPLPQPYQLKVKLYIFGFSAFFRFLRVSFFKNHKVRSSHVHQCVPDLAFHSLLRLSFRKLLAGTPCYGFDLPTSHQNQLGQRFYLPETHAVAEGRSFAARCD